MEKSTYQGLIGLTNDSLICYMNSTLQCLSNTLDLCRPILENKHFENINFTMKNIHGSRGEVACAFSDVLKKLWSYKGEDSRYREIDPMTFKHIFGKRFDNFN